MKGQMRLFETCSAEKLQSNILVVDARPELWKS